MSGKIAVRRDKRGRVAVPEPGYEALSLKPGDIIGWRVFRGKATLSQANEDDAQLRLLGRTLGEWNSKSDRRAYDDL